jgi:holo-[acyl-carrier protein] synthase
MAIAGLGTRILECVKVSELIHAHGEKFLREVYTDREIAFCRSRTHSTEYFTAIWAAKEAVLHSLGVRWKRGIDWLDVEIVCEHSAEMQVELGGPIRKLQSDRGIGSIRVCYSHTRHYATATAIAEAG